MVSLTDKILKATKDLKEDDAMMQKWKMIKEFVETHEITKKNLEEARKAAQFIEKFEEFPNGTFKLEWGDPYCKKYGKNPNCEGCPIAEYGGASCNEPSHEVTSEKVVIIGPAEPGPVFRNPFGNLVAQLDFYLAYDDENSFLDDHKQHKSMRGALLSVINEITNFLEKAIEYLEKED